MLVTIPSCLQHEGYYSMRVELPPRCPVCGGPRATTTTPGLSFDGSRRLAVDTWANPCGHVDGYADVRAEVAAVAAATEAAKVAAAAPEEFVSLFTIKSTFTLTDGFIYGYFQPEEFTEMLHASPSLHNDPNAVIEVRALREYVIDVQTIDPWVLRKVPKQKALAGYFVRAASCAEWLAQQPAVAQ